MPTQLGSATRTARKMHHCGLCGAMIKVDEHHHVSTNVFDARVYDFRTCSACEADGICAAVYVWCHYPSEGVVLEEAWEWAHEHRGEPPADRYLSRCGCTCEHCKPEED